MEIVVWLRSLGLGKYEAVFRENEIDETVLPNLTAEDLKELGVTALGHRRKLLDAIGALRNDTSSAQGPSSDLKTAPGGCIGAAWHRRYRHACHLGTIGIFVCEAVFRHASTKRSLNITANCVFASNHSRGGRFQ